MYKMKIQLIKDRYIPAFLDIAKVIANLSYAKKKKVGAVIVSNNRLLASGYNGTPTGSDNTCEDLVIEKKYRCSDVDCRNHREGIIKFTDADDIDSAVCTVCFNKIEVYTEERLVTRDSVIHAEENAILQCARYGISTDGTVMLVTDSPCEKCARLIAEAGITTVYYDKVHKEGVGLLKLLDYGLAVIPTSEEATEWSNKWRGGDFNV